MSDFIPGNQLARANELNVGGDRTWKEINTSVTASIDLSDSTYDGYVNFLITLPASGQTTTINLPPMQAGRDREYYFYVNTDGDGVAVVQDRNDAEVSGNNYTSGNLTAAGDFLLIRGTGVAYHEIVELTT